MNKKLTNALLDMDEWEFKALAIHIDTAEAVRELIKKYSVSYNRLAEELEIKEEDIKSVLMGAYEFDLRFISKLQVLRDKLYSEKNPIVTFPEYKHSETIET